MKIAMPASVKFILDTLQEEGYQSFIYGACVRDSLLGVQPIIWDITTAALPPEIILLFDDRPGFTAVPAASDYGIVSLIYQGENYRVSTFRSGIELRFSEDVAEELSHNDFTMNSIAYNSGAGLIDPFGGIADIEHRMIRCTSDPLISIRKDSIRILRAIRFEAQLGFTMDPSLLAAIRSSEDAFSFYHSEKACNEFTQILLTTQPSLSIRRLQELGLLKHLIPELIPTVNFDTRSSYHDQDVFVHTLAVLDLTKPDLSLRLAALLHDIGKPACLTIDASGEGHCFGHAGIGADMAKTVLTRLNLDPKTITIVQALIKEHMNDYDNASELSIRRLIRRIGPDNICNLFELQLADIQASPRTGRDFNRVQSIRTKCWEVLSRREPLTTHELELTGYDLMPFYSSGKEIGEALEYLLDKVIDNPSLNDKVKLFALLEIGLPEPKRD
ncbi:MAG: HD domain-containing protein [Firmicutes bacterium]|nr:HD domain-containing protein [Bacillota bacterium]